jgi:hypothetical protein
MPFATWMVLPGAAAATAADIVDEHPDVPPGFTHSVAPLAVTDVIRITLKPAIASADLCSDVFFIRSPFNFQLVEIFPAEL